MVLGAGRCMVLAVGMGIVVVVRGMGIVVVGGVAVHMQDRDARRRTSWYPKKSCFDF